jgi:hypothetical protein
MILFWVTTDDHHEDWFVVASSRAEATRYFENYEGYPKGSASAEEILEIPVKLPVESGWPSEELLQELGAKFVSNGNTRVLEIGGRKFAEGMLERIINEINDELFEELSNERPNKTKKSTPH